MTQEEHKAMVRRRHKKGGLKVYNFIKAEVIKPPQKKSIRKASKKYLAEIDAEIEQEKKKTAKVKRAAKKLENKNTKKRDKILQGF